MPLASIFFMLMCRPELFEIAVFGCDPGPGRRDAALHDLRTCTRAAFRRCGRQRDAAVDQVTELRQLEYFVAGAEGRTSPALRNG